LARRGWRGRMIGHAYGDATWGVVGTALACGDHIRVGFEDALTLPNGREAKSNADLVARAVAMARAVGRLPFTPAELVLSSRG
jgi:3-keto-5-aminohexanoate cleavage enzyme